MADLQLAWSEDGAPDGPPVLMGSSLGTTREMWTPGLEHLGEFRVIRFDHLGHGQSQVPQGPYSMELLAGAVLELMDHLGIQRASYAGLSLGGAVGQWLAAFHPERVDRLALLATAAYFPDPAGWAERAQTVREQGTQSVADMAMTRWFTERFRQERPGEVAQWREMVAATPDEGYAGCCEALAGYDLREAIAQITAPTLAIAGADDPSTSPETMQVIVDAIPGCRLEVVDDAAHLPNVAHPDQVGGLLAAHLRGAR